MLGDPAPIFVAWERVASEILERTSKFAKVHRFTFAQRIDNLVIDVLEGLAAAQLSRGDRKRELLEEADRNLLRLRVVLRLAHTRKVLDHGGYEHTARAIDEVGRMLGGWRRQQESAP